MSRQDWSVIRRHVPNYLTCPYLWLGCIGGAIFGAVLLEVILNFCQR